MMGDNSSSREKPSLYQATVARQRLMQSSYKADKIFPIAKRALN